MGSDLVQIESHNDSGNRPFNLVGRIIKAMKKSTASIEAKTKFMDNLIMTMGRKSFESWTGRKIHDLHHASGC